jgi:hypothetical protein
MAPTFATASDGVNKPGTGHQRRWTRSTWADQDKSEAKHPVAVARSLQWADEAAKRGEHSDALAWLHVIEAIGDELPETYQAKRQAWLLAFGTDG